MTASNRSFIWLVAILLGLLPLAGIPDEPFTAAWDQSAAWEDAENDARILREHLTRPPANPALFPSCGLLSAATAPGDRLLPQKGSGIPQGPILSRQLPRAPPIPRPPDLSHPA
jgi:hypothetical protein